MRPIRESFRDLRVWASMHILIGFAVPVVLLFFFGCNELKEEKAPIGVPVEAAVIQEKLEEALEETSVHSVNKNQQVVYEYNQTIENGQASPYLWVKQHVIEVFDTEESFSYKYNEISEDPNADPGTKPIVVEKDSGLYLPRSESLLQTFREKGHYALKNIKFFSDNRAEVITAEKPVKWTSYHDLHVEKEIQSAPPIVRSRPNCRDVPNCEIRVTKIRFDQIQWHSSDDWSKIRYYFEISPDVPYLGNVISNCIGVQVPYEQRTVYVKECQVLLDFAFGDPPQ